MRAKIPTMIVKQPVFEIKSATTCWNVATPNCFTYSFYLLYFVLFFKY